MDRALSARYGIAAALVAVAFVCACGGTVGGRAEQTTGHSLPTPVSISADESTATASPTAASTGSPSPHAVDRVLSGTSIEITPDLDGLTVQVPASEVFLINLGDGYRWSLEWSPPGVARSWLATYQPRGSQGYYSLDVPGSSALLDGRGTPICATPVPAATCASGAAATFHLSVVAGPPQ